MRITGGLARGRKLTSPKSGQQFIRPTSDRTREALCNILAGSFSGSRVLDLFAGTGAFGLEALSRGAVSAVFVDHSQESRQLIATNIRTCFPKETPKAGFHQLQLDKPSALAQLRSKYPAPYSFDLIFLDPPYEKNLAERVLAMVEETNLYSADGYVIAEERKQVLLTEKIGRLTLHDQRTYGETGLWFYRRDDI